MDSFALAYIPAKEEIDYDFSIKVNINLWTQCGWGNDEPVLDIGLMVSKISSSAQVRVYIPFTIQKKNLTDLCECLSMDADLLGAVFNEPYTSADVPEQKKKAEVFEGKSKKTKFILYKLDFSCENDVKLSPYKKDKQTKGTFLDFNTKNIVGNIENGDCDTYYLRFRIQSSELKKCVREYEAPNRYFETLVNSTYMVDIRFNNTRSMDRSLVQELTTQNGWSLAPINGLHFLLMTKVDVDVSNDFNSSRVLEKETWNKYVNPNKEGRTTEDIIAYHSSKKFILPQQMISDEHVVQDIGSWEFFTRVKAGHCNAKTIIPYVILLVLFNVASNIVFNMLCITINMNRIITQTAILAFIGIACWYILIKKKKKRDDN